MHSLAALVARESLSVPALHLDRFQERVLAQLHLEFFFARCRALVTPSYSQIVTGEASGEEAAQLAAIIDERQELLEQLKRRLVCELALHTALLESSSAVIELNEHLAIARLVSWRDAFEVKLYTLGAEDLPDRYDDKIYLGRDLFHPGSLEREHFGLGYLRDSLLEQAKKLEGRLARLAPALVPELEADFLADFREQLEELSSRADAVLGGYPPRLGPEPATALLLELNGRFREIKHTLVEANELLAEMEARLFGKAPRAARYVTKLRKDVTNDVNFIMMKVNGRIADRINGIQL
ncbi:MAG: hypothetical protein AB7O37_15375 [Vicinamibacteria bacterium]